MYEQEELFQDTGLGEMDVIERMDEEKLVDHLKRHTQDARDYIDTKLQEKWKNSQRYYYGEKMGNEAEGKSQVISRDVSDAVDWMMPSLMDIFSSGKNAVMFEPQTADDVQTAEEMTNYANYVFYRKNPGFMLLHNYFKDALLFNVGIVKHYWEDIDKVSTETYSGLDQGEIDALLSRENTELIALTDYGDGLFDAEMTVVKRCSQIRIENVPPEEFLIDRHAKCVQDAKYVGHQRQVRRTDLVEMGLSDEVIATLNQDVEDQADDSMLRQIREQYNGSNQQDYDNYGLDQAGELYWIVESYIRIDYDGDGLAELRRIVHCGNIIISNEDWDRIPFSTITPNPIQHEFYGQSVYDMVHDVQEVKTALLRNQLDNMYLTNSGRYVAVEGQVNLSDLQNNKPGGVVREKMQGALRPLPQPPLPQGSYDMIGYYDELKTNRTGVSARTQGLDDKILNSHTGQGQVNKVMSVAEQRLKLVARVFAETGVRNLFFNIQALAKKHQVKEEVFRLNGKFMTIDPSAWNDRTDMEIVVGLGTNDKDQQLMHLSRLFELQQSIGNAGGLGILTNETKIYNLLKEFTENAGYKDPEKFWLDPATEESKAAKAAKEKAAAQPTSDDIKAQADMKKAQSDAQIDQLKVQQEASTSQQEMQIKLKELEIAEREMALKEREQAMQEDKSDLERDKFEWSKQVNIAEVVLEQQSERPAAIGDNKVVKKSPQGQGNKNSVK